MIYLQVVLVLQIISKIDIKFYFMCIFFGTVYKKTGNLRIPIIFHFLINVCALPYQFSSIKGYANITLYVIVPVYIVLGIYSIFALKKEDEKTG